MYLMCILKDGRHDYTEISEAEEQKISALYRAKKLPATWNLKGKSIVTDTILGFSDKALPSEQKTIEPGRKFNSWADLRTWVHQQAWYLKNQEQPEKELPGILQGSFLPD